MVKTVTKTKTNAVKSVAKKTVPKKSPAQKKATKTTSQKVDYYPNRVPFYTAVAAVMILLLLAVIVSL